MLVVKTTDPALAQSRIAVLEQGLAVLEWTATLKPNSKNRALVSRTRRLADKAREAVARLPAANAAAAMNGFGLAVGTGEGSTVDTGAAAGLAVPTQEPGVPSIPFFDFTLPKVEPDLPLPLHLTADLTAITSTPSDGSGVGPSSSIPWSTAPGGMDMPAELSFAMPLAPSTNDDQFDAWLAMLFPSENVVGDEWMDHPSWNSGTGSAGV